MKNKMERTGRKKALGMMWYAIDIFFRNDPHIRRHMRDNARRVVNRTIDPMDPQDMVEEHIEHMLDQVW